MAEFVPFDLNVHKEVFVKLNVEFITWIADQFRENYQLDSVSNIGQTIPEYVDAHLEDLTSLKPPDGIIYLLVDGGDIAGMGAIRKLRKKKRIHMQFSMSIVSLSSTMNPSLLARVTRNLLWLLTEEFARPTRVTLMHAWKDAWEIRVPLKALEHACLYAKKK